MKIKSEGDKRNYIIIALCAVLVVMGVGYAAFSSLLTINGTANISNSWCVGFDNTKTDTYEVKKGVSTGEAPTGTMTYSGTACETNYIPNASLTAVFHQPGDQITYTLTIKNKSSVTAVIKSILVDGDSVSTNTTKRKENIIYIINMPADTTLSPDEETTMTVVAKVQNDTPIGSGYTGESESITVGINTEQDDGNGGMDITPVSNKFTGTIYRWNTTNANNGDSIVPVSGTKWCDIETSSGNQYDCFDTETECNTFLSENNFTETDTCQQKTGTFGGVGDYTTDASTLNKTYYLKHDVEEDIITASYVCFVYNNAEHCMKGGDGGASFAANTQTIKDFQTFNNLGDYDSSTNTGCVFASSNSICHGGGFDHVFASSDANVRVNGSSSEHCHVGYDGSSRCGE